MSLSHVTGFTGECGREAEALPARDLFTVAVYLDPTQAHIMQGRLAASGIPAAVADDQLVQTNTLWTAAVGGVRILVPRHCIDDAKAVIAAFERGDFALPDDIPE